MFPEMTCRRWLIGYIWLVGTCVCVCVCVMTLFVYCCAHYIGIAVISSWGVRQLRVKQCQSLGRIYRIASPAHHIPTSILAFGWWDVPPLRAEPSLPYPRQLPQTQTHSRSEQHSCIICCCSCYPMMYTHSTTRNTAQQPTTTSCDCINFLINTICIICEWSKSSEYRGWAVAYCSLFLFAHLCHVIKVICTLRNCRRAE